MPSAFAGPQSAAAFKPSDSSTASSSPNFSSLSSSFTSGEDSPPPPRAGPTSSRPSPASAFSASSAAGPSHAAARDGHTGRGDSAGSQASRTAISEVSSATLQSSSPVVFIALHAGAGYHNPAHHVDLQELFHAACQLALTQAGSAEEAVYLAIQLLEASPLTNAGRGSVLTEDGRVECEASMMLGNGAYSGVAAVCGVEHPIQLAYQLVKERNEYGLIKELGRVRPILLVGEGAWKYAEEKGFARVGPEEWHDHHVTAETRRKWKKFKAIIDKHKRKQATATEDIRRAEQQKVAEQQQRKQQKRRSVQPDSSSHSQEPATTHSPSKKRPRSTHSSSPSAAHVSPPNAHSAHSDADSDSDNDSPFHGKQHGTVGAIACDEHGHVCAGVSSGGIWMKTAGRIGSAALIGCGCHAENGDDETKVSADSSKTDAVSVACSISGCGEDIIEELMAVRCCDAMKGAKLSPPPSPTNSIIETNAPVTIDSGSDSSDGSSPPAEEKHTEMQRIMKQLIEKEQMRQATFTANDKKRRKNAQGSNDTQQQDDGLSSGIIACRVVRGSRAGRSSSGSTRSSSRADHRERDEKMDGGGGSSSKDGDGQGERDHNSSASDELTLDFCYAHTAPHFAVGYAVNDRINGYQNRGWISQQSEEQTKRRIMKLGQMTIAIQPIQQHTHTDGEDSREQSNSRGHSGQQREQPRREDGEKRDGHVTESTDEARHNGRKKQQKRRDRDENQNEDKHEDGDKRKQ